jgi:hypothetical protein
MGKGKIFRGRLLDAAAFFIGAIGVGLMASKRSIFGFMPETGYFSIDLLIDGCMSVALIWALYRGIKRIVGIIKWGRR